MDRLFVFFYTTQCVFTSMNTGWVIHAYKTVNRRHSDNKENIDRSIVSYKTAVQYFNMLGCRHFKQRKTVFFLYSRQICDMLSIDDLACYMYCVYNMQHASSWRSINTIWTGPCSGFNQRGCATLSELENMAKVSPPWCWPPKLLVVGKYIALFVSWWRQEGGRATVYVRECTVQYTITVRKH